MISGVHSIIVASPVTRFFGLWTWCAPRRLARCIRILRGWDVGLLTLGTRTTRGRQALEQGRDLVKRNTLISESFDKHNLLLLLGIQPCTTGGPRDTWEWRSLVGVCRMRRSTWQTILSWHLGEGKGKGGWQIHTRLRARRVRCRRLRLRVRLRYG